MTPERDYFQVFGLARGYAVDLAELDARYERLSFDVHPDFFAAATPAEKQRAERLAAELNAGYRTLRDEPERAAYLLGLLAAGRALDTRQLPAGFLQQMFALQEQVDELEAAPEPAAKAELGRAVAARLDAVRAERVALFARALAGATPELLQALQSNVNCEKYLLRLQARLA
ncbi:MAG: Fe-S protein assembly co-chaperone HscB [Candidatus Lambdaproteobacteria bacterium]|nr:Fe-S protein assembly co-chaperone HscB [Candidatus Lambdaproteobacteria bacterium]